MARGCVRHAQALQKGQEGEAGAQALPHLKKGPAGPRHAGGGAHAQPVLAHARRRQPPQVERERPVFVKEAELEGVAGGLVGRRSSSRVGWRGMRRRGDCRRSGMQGRRGVRSAGAHWAESGCLAAVRRSGGGGSPGARRRGRGRPPRGRSSNRGRAAVQEAGREAQLAQARAQALQHVPPALIQHLERLQALGHGVHAAPVARRLPQPAAVGVVVHQVPHPAHAVKAREKPAGGQRRQVQLGVARAAGQLMHVRVHQLVQRRAPPALLLRGKGRHDALRLLAHREEDAAQVNVAVLAQVLGQGQHVRAQAGREGSIEGWGAVRHGARRAQQ